MISDLAHRRMPTSAQHLHIRHRLVEVLRVSHYLRRSLPPDSLIQFLLFFRFISSLAFFSVVGWRAGCPLGGLTGLSTFDGGK